MVLVSQNWLYNKRKSSYTREARHESVSFINRSETRIVLSWDKGIGREGALRNFKVLETFCVSQALVAHVCNPSYSGRRGQKDSIRSHPGRNSS
jgi:hypothetical protein